MELQEHLEIEDYIRETGVLDNFNKNLSEILDLIPDSGIRFQDLIINNPSDLFIIFSNDISISQKMNEYVSILDNKDMIVLSIVTDVALKYEREGGNDFSLFYSLINSTSDENFRYNFIIVCISYMKYHLMPEILTSDDDE